MKIKDKVVENKLYVYIELQSMLTLVGTLQFHEDNYAAGSMSATFSYAESYLDNPLAFSLDPINLPLSKKEFYTESKFNRLGVLFDAAPDSWGRKIIEFEHDNISEYDILVKGRGNNVGAISFSKSLITNAQTQTNFHITQLSDSREINEVVNSINNLLAHKDFNRNFLESSWDIGGARPKIVAQYQSEQYLIKFYQDKDLYDKQKVEHACLRMAQDIGMNVSESFLVPVDNSHDAIFIRRFDRQNSEKQHYISAASLVSPPSDFEKRQLDTLRGKIIFSYAKVADIIRKISCNPVSDLLELYTRMCFNVAIHNTDDHLKNTGFVKTPKGYRLSPLFDVSPQPPSLHMIHIGELGRVGSYENLISSYKQFGIKNISIAESIIQKVNDIVSHKEQYFHSAGLSETDIDYIYSNISFPLLQKPSETPVLKTHRRKV